MNDIRIDDLFVKSPLIPAIIVDYKNNTVLMLAYMNKPLPNLASVITQFSSIVKLAIASS